MNEDLILAILTPTGIKLLSHFPTTKRTALIIEQIAEIAGVPITSAYRHIKDLRTWDNIVSVKNRSDTGGRPEWKYYIKSKNFTIRLKSSGTELSVIK